MYVLQPPRSGIGVWSYVHAREWMMDSMGGRMNLVPTNTASLFVTIGSCLGLLSPLNFAFSILIHLATVAAQDALAFPSMPGYALANLLGQSVIFPLIFLTGTVHA